MKRIVALGSLVAVGALSVVVAAFQQPTQRAVLPELQKVKDNLYIFGASNPGDLSQFTGGNTGVYVGQSGVVLVDTKLAGYAPDILSKIHKITDKAVIMIVNTHSHGDHTGSNEGFSATVDIVAHENTKSNMEKMDAFKGDKAKFLPRRTFQDKMSLLSGTPDRIDLYYFGAGHTSGDTWVVYPGLRVLQTGDMFAWKDAPRLDRANGGSGVQFPKTIAKALAAITNVDIVIPGHSPVMALKDLQEYQRYTADLLSGVEAAKKAGKSAADAAASLKLGAKYPQYKSDRVRAAVDAIYAELDGK
jgi:glyoxylase-like metal-dependent hydrolase (beta-lactamase superfamily II)